jgi:hypothetical protein
MRDHGRGEDGNISVWGYNSRLDNLQAAILNYFFDDYDPYLINTLLIHHDLALQPHNSGIYQSGLCRY